MAEGKNTGAPSSPSSTGQALSPRAPKQLYLGCKKEGCNGVLCVPVNSSHGTPFHCPRCLNREKYCIDCKQLYINFRRHRNIGHELYEFQRKRQVLIRNNHGLFIPAPKPQYADGGGMTVHDESKQNQPQQQQPRGKGAASPAKIGGRQSRAMSHGAGGGAAYSPSYHPREEEEMELYGAGRMGYYSSSNGGMVPPLPLKGEYGGGFPHLAMIPETERQAGDMTGESMEVGEELDDASDILVKLMHGNRGYQYDRGNAPSAVKMEESPPIGPMVAPSFGPSPPPHQHHHLFPSSYPPMSMPSRLQLNGGHSPPLPPQALYPIAPPPLYSSIGVLLSMAQSHSVPVPQQQQAPPLPQHQPPPLPSVSWTMTTASSSTPSSSSSSPPHHRYNSVYNPENNQQPPTAAHWGPSAASSVDSSTQYAPPTCSSVGTMSGSEAHHHRQHHEDNNKVSLEV